MAMIMTEEKRAELLQFLSEDLDKALLEREKLEKRWLKWQRQREAIPEQETRNYPWPKASNVCVPLAAINTEGTFAKLKGVFSGKHPFWMVGTRDPRKWQKHADALTDFIDFYAESKYHLNIREHQNTLLYCAGSEGAAFVKVMWLEEKRQFKRKDSNGDLQIVEKVIHDGPALVPVPIQDMIFRACTDLQRVPVLHHKLYFYEHELLERKARGLYENVDVVKEFYETKFKTEIEQESLKRLGVEPGPGKLFPVFESWVHFDVDGDGITEDVIVHWERASLTMMREDYNEMGVRLVEPLKFGIRPWDVYGIGAGWKNEHMQDEVDGLHNWRNDGVHLAGLRMFAAKKTGLTMEGEEELYPGKIWPMDNPKEDVIALQAGEIYPSSLEAELVSRNYSREWNGVSDATVGQPDTVAKTRTTLGGQLNQIQQQGVMFSAVSQQMQESWSNVGMMLLFVIQRHKDRIVKDLARFPEDTRRLVLEALDMDVEDIPARFTFEVQTTDVEQSLAARRQARLTLVQLYTMFWKEVANILMVLNNPQIPEGVKIPMMKAYTGACRLMEKIFEDFDEKDTDDYIPDYRLVEQKVMQMEEAITQMMAIRGGTGGYQQGAIPGPQGAGGIGGLGGGQAFGQGAERVISPTSPGQPGA